MILKRKQLKEAEVGDVATINYKALVKMYNRPEYTDQSASHYCRNLDNAIRSRHLRKSNSKNNKIFLCDSELVYVNKNSIFGSDLVEVVPLKIRQDDFLYALDHLMKSKSKGVFLIPKNSLCYAGNSTIENAFASNNVKDRIKNIIKTNINPNFSWEGR